MEERSKLSANLLSVIFGLIYCVFITLSSVCVQGLQRRVGDFELNIFRSVGPTVMVLPWLLKVYICYSFLSFYLVSNLHEALGSH